MINLQTRLKNIDFDIENYQVQAQKALDALGYSDFDLGIMLTTNATIKKYNAQYRNKDKATDVLSFPFHHIKAGTKIKVKSDDDKNLGDMIISIEYVQAAAKKLGTTFEKRMNRMLIHSICHLLGYDHIQDDEFAIMIKKEKSLAQAINLDCSWD
ncbi:rRNA maturation RNase YbeY [Candidatus Babeliales bacterium]|nr:rRNA maturation RNase YbeY [Candidatus Babeliales bacterium]MBP9844159.1 rRNA maturation RNase YbeY [Candidatus Babeliales bacterium]